MNVVLVKKRQPDDDHRSLLDDGIELGFADGHRGLIPYGEVPEVRNREGISGLELPNPYEMVLRTVGGRERRNSLGLRPPLLRRNLPANRRSHSSPGEADHRPKGPPVPGIGRVDPGGAGPGS